MTYSADNGSGRFARCWGWVVVMVVVIVVMVVMAMVCYPPPDLHRTNYAS